jgi:CheY-like chemotaxis protein
VNPKVLIVDDDVNAGIIAETLLRLRGLDVQIACDGAEACEMVERNGTAVVVLDLTLPEMNGFEVLRRLRGRFESLRLRIQPRIVVTSARREPEVERFALQLGADAFLYKPIDPHRLIRIVEQLVAAPSVFWSAAPQQ